MDKKQEQMMKEKYADMYITMLSLLNEEEMAAKPTPTPLEPVAEIEADYSSQRTDDRGAGDQDGQATARGSG